MPFVKWKKQIPETYWSTNTTYELLIKMNLLVLQSKEIEISYGVQLPSSVLLLHDYPPVVTKAKWYLTNYWGAYPKAKW